MKKVTVIIFLIIGLVGQSLFAQVVDSKGRVIDAKGNVYIDGTQLGTVTMDSVVKNANGKPMAFLKPGGVLVNAKGKTLGRVGKDGLTYYNADGAVVYKLKENTDSETCDVLDANGNVIGNVHNNYKAMACTLHCYSNNMDSKTHRKNRKGSKNMSSVENSIDLVCGMKVNKSEAYTYKYKDVEYFFDTKDCKAAFKMNPEKFIKN